MSRNRQTISLCMIVKNEADMLRDCLDSVRSEVDEIVVVDTGSTDGTIELLDEYRVKRYSYEWNDNFSAARNFSLEKATGDWILVLDADERILPENLIILRETVENAGSVAYYLNFRSPVMQSSSGKIHVHQYARLFQNGKNIRFSGRIHEQIIHSVTTAGGEISPTEIYVEHLGYSASSMQERHKNERNMRILLKELKQKPDDGMVCFFLGETSSLLENWNDAVKYYKMGLEKNLPTENRALLLQNLGSAYHNLNDYDKSIKHERLSLELIPDRITPHTVIAESAAAGGNLDLAVFEWNVILDRIAEEETGAFERLADFVPDFVQTSFRLAEIYYRSGDYQSCLRTCRSALQKDAEALDIRLLSAYALSMLDNKDGAMREVQKIFDHYRDHTGAMLLAGKIETLSGNTGSAKKWFSRILELEPDNTEAQKALRDISSRSQNSDASIKEKVEELLKDGRPADAKSLLEDVLKTTEDYELFFLMAYANSSLGDLTGTIDMCDKSLKRFDTDPRVHFMKGSALLNLNRSEEAVSSFEKAVLIEPKLFEAWASLGVSRVKLQNFESAKAAFEQAHKLQPEDMAMKRNLAAVCGKLGLQEEAEKYLLMTKM